MEKNYSNKLLTENFEYQSTTYTIEHNQMLIHENVFIKVKTRKFKQQIRDLLIS